MTRELAATSFYGSEVTERLLGEISPDEDFKRIEALVELFHLLILAGPSEGVSPDSFRAIYNDASHALARLQARENARWG